MIYVFKFTGLAYRRALACLKCSVLESTIKQIATAFSSAFADFAGVLTKLFAGEELDDAQAGMQACKFRNTKNWSSELDEKVDLKLVVDLNDHADNLWT